VYISIDARSRSDDGWRLFDELAETCAGPVLVELPKPLDVPEPPEPPEVGKLVTMPAEVAED
jgi:hypothetical protein